MVSLPTGQLLILGGKGGPGIEVPEIYTYGEGWKSLTGATDGGMAAGWNYPRALAKDDGTILYFPITPTAEGGEQASYRVMLLDPEGDGSLEQIATLLFTVNSSKPSTDFAPGKALIQANDGGLWVMDFNADTPSFENVAELPTGRNWSNMTVLADGTVMINGASSSGNRESGADKTAVIRKRTR